MTQADSDARDARAAPVASTDDDTGAEPSYRVRREAASRFLTIRGLRTHALVWGDESMVTPERPTLLMLHGWMDVAASFQFIVDAFAADRQVVAIDWRGFGLTESPPVDTYWLPDYLGDLDGVVDALAPGRPLDLLGHSMGGNTAMLYAGIRPERIRRLVNLEGFGMPTTQPEQAPRRYAQWLDQLKKPETLRPYPSLDAVAQRLRQTNPLLPMARARWLAAHWSRRRPGSDGPPDAWELLADPAHKRINPNLYQTPETLACWRLIAAPVLWIEGDRTDVARWWGTRYTKAELHERLNVIGRAERHVVGPAGHMLHHDRPEDVARLVEAFLDRA